MFVAIKGMLLEEQSYKGNEPMTAYTREYTGWNHPSLEEKDSLRNRVLKRWGATSQRTTYELTTYYITTDFDKKRSC
jgi:hypothetical protein